MAYQQTTATSVSDILNSIAAFAAPLGWTVARNNTFVSGSNDQRVLSLSRSGCDHAHFYSEVGLATGTKNTIFTSRSIAINTALSGGTQPNKSGDSRNNLLSAGPYVKLHLFGESGANPYIHCVLEHQAGRYRHFGIGELIKSGTWVGGSYCTGTLWATSSSNAYDPMNSESATPFGHNAIIGGWSWLRCDDCDALNTRPNPAGIDSRYIMNARENDSSYSRKFYTGYRSGNQYTDGIGALIRIPTSAYNQRTQLIHLACFMDSAGDYMRYVGEPNAMRAVNVSPFADSEILTIGSDEWMIFPACRKGFISGPSTEEYSGDYGYAYKKVP